VQFPPTGEFGGDVNGGNGTECQRVGYGHVTLIEVREDRPAGVCDFCLTWIGLVVAEIWGEESPPQYNLRFFESVGSRIWNKFWRSGGMVL